MLIYKLKSEIVENYFQNVHHVKKMNTCQRMLSRNTINNIEITNLNVSNS